MKERKLINSHLKPIVVGDYSPSKHEASRILEPNGLAPTIKENHGTINAVIVYGRKNSKS